MKMNNCYFLVLRLIERLGYTFKIIHFNQKLGIGYWKEAQQIMILKLILYKLLGIPTFTDV